MSRQNLWAAARSSARGGSASALLASAMVPLGRLGQGTRVIIDGVEVAVTGWAKQDGKYVVTCEPTSRTRRHK